MQFMHVAAQMHGRIAESISLGLARVSPGLLLAKAPVKRVFWCSERIVVGTYLYIIPYLIVACALGPWSLSNRHPTPPEQQISILRLSGCCIPHHMLVIEIAI